MLNLLTKIFLCNLTLCAAILGCAQDVGVLNEEDLIGSNEMITDGVRLIQLGNQNTADIVQFQSLDTQLLSYQQGDKNFINLTQSGSGTIQTVQYGLSNYMTSYLSGVNIEAQLYQFGEENIIRQWSNANNPSYQFIQEGNNIFIEHLNSGSNNMGLIIRQSGNDMSISIFTR